MAIKITNVQEALIDNGLKILVHGLAGSGKTVLCATTGEPTLIVSAESGLLSIAHAPNHIKTTVVKTIHELEEVYDYLLKNIDLFKWVCIDSISEISEVLLADEKKNSRDPRQAYGNLQDRMLSILRGFRDLPKMNVLMSCKQQRQIDEDTNVTRFVPLLPGKSLTNSIGYLFDEVFALRVEKDKDGNDYRVLQTGRDRNYEAKDRSNVLEMFEKPNMKNILDKIRENNIIVKTESLKPDSNSSLKDNCNFYDENNVNSIEENNEVIMAGNEPVYLYHKEHNKVMKLEAGNSIDDDGYIEIIDFKTYMNYKGMIKATEEENNKENDQEHQVDKLVIIDEEH